MPSSKTRATPCLRGQPHHGRQGRETPRHLDHGHDCSRRLVWPNRRTIREVSPSTTTHALDRPANCAATCPVRRTASTSIPAKTLRREVSDAYTAMAGRGPCAPTSSSKKPLCPNSVGYTCVNEVMDDPMLTLYAIRAYRECKEQWVRPIYSYIYPPANLIYFPARLALSRPRLSPF